MQKNYWLWGLCFSCLSLPVHAWVITDYKVKADIQSDGTVQVEEHITGDFTNDLQKHGIFRDIPFRYKDENNKSFKTPLTNITVSNQNGQPRTFVQTKNGSDLSLKIGEAHKTVEAEETYIIKYAVSGVINTFKTYDEFYWNVTGNEWDAPILKTSALVTLPKPTQLQQTTCYTGPQGSKQQNCQHQLDESAQAALFKSDKPLARGQGFTVVFGWDKNLVTIPERIYEINWAYWAQRLQLLFLLLPALALFINLKLRRSLKIDKPVIPLYRPLKNISIGKIGILQRYKTTPLDLSAILIQLCVKQVMTIRVDKDKGLFGDKPDYKFITTKSSLGSLNEEEKFVYDHIFGVNKITTIPLNFISGQGGSIFHYLTFQELAKLIKTNTNHLRFESNNFRLNGIWSILVIFLFLLGGLAIAIWISIAGKTPLPIISLLGSVFLMLLLRPKLNAQGAKLKHELKGFKLFLETAEKQKINWSEAQNIFETNLPYAISLGLTDKWAEFFGDKVNLPAWINTKDKSFHFKDLEKNITLASTKAFRATAPRSTSSSRGSSGFGGGGSSGGGFGGGGGRSW